MSGPACPKCGTANAADAVICGNCDYILDTSFLGDDILNQPTTDDQKLPRPPTEEAGDLGSDFGGEALILGKLPQKAGDDAFDSFMSDRTGSFLTADTGDVQRVIEPAPVYVDKSTQAMLEANAVLALKDGVDTRRLALSPFEQHVLAFVDGKRPVARIRKKAGLSASDAKIALAMIVDRGVLVLKGRVTGADMGDDLDDDDAAFPDPDSTHADPPSDDSLGDFGEHTLPVADATPGIRASSVETSSIHTVATAPRPAHIVTQAVAPQPQSESLAWVEPDRSVAFADDEHATSPMTPQLADTSLPRAPPPLPGQRAAASPPPGPPAARAVPPGNQPVSRVVAPVASAAHQKAMGLYELALADLRAGKKARAHMYAKMAKEAFADDPKINELLANWGQAEHLAKKESEDQRLFADAQRAEDAGEYAKAIHILKQAIAVNPNAAELHNRMGVILATRIADHTAASNALLKAVELDPKNLVYRSNLGKVFKMSEGQKNVGGFITDPNAVVRSAPPMPPKSMLDRLKGKLK